MDKDARETLSNRIEFRISSVVKWLIAKYPGSKVDREKYLRRALSPHVSSEIVEKAIATRPSDAGIPLEDITRMAKSTIALHRLGVTAASSLCGLPGFPIVLWTTAPDIGQFYWHILVVVQKLAYLYGWPPLTDESGELDDESIHRITLFLGSAMGVAGATGVVSALAKELAKQVAIRLPKEALAKVGFYVIVRDVVKWFSVRLVKATFAKWVAECVPFLGAIVSGLLTWIWFSIMARRLRIYFESLPLATRQLQ